MSVTTLDYCCFRHAYSSPPCCQPRAPLLDVTADALPLPCCHAMRTRRHCRAALPSAIRQRMPLPFSPMMIIDDRDSAVRPADDRRRPRRRCYFDVDKRYMLHTLPRYAISAMLMPTILMPPDYLRHAYFASPPRQLPTPCRHAE